MMQKRSPTDYRFRRGFAAALLSLVPALGGCEPRGNAPPPRVYRDEPRFGLTFEERMAIPPELSRLRADAQRRANAIYDPFRSREDASHNDELTTKLYETARVELMQKRHLTDEQLAEIVREYQASLGGNLR